MTVVNAPLTASPPMSEKSEVFLSLKANNEVAAVYRQNNLPRTPSGTSAIEEQP